MFFICHSCESRQQDLRQRSLSGSLASISPLPPSREQLNSHQNASLQTSLTYGFLPNMQTYHIHVSHGLLSFYALTYLRLFLQSTSSHLTQKELFAFTFHGCRIGRQKTVITEQVN